MVLHVSAFFLLLLLLLGLFSFTLTAAQTSRCEVTTKTVNCSYNTMTVHTEYDRTVYWQTPSGTPPAAGWPVVIAFQGSFIAAQLFWSGSIDSPLQVFGIYYQALLINNLLTQGYAILTPDALFNGHTFWETNIPPFDVDWKISDDNRLMLELFHLIANGTFGPLDSTRLHATGISSGGYMTSRMAVNYTTRFRSLAIESASYATCSGPICYVPKLPADHPPTLFLQGLLDPIVPAWTMELYYHKLKNQNTPTEKIIDPIGVHQWIPEAPAAVPAWFNQWNS